MVTELQQQIYDEIAKYPDLETARANAEKIAELCDCSDTYVRRLISRREEESTEIKFKVAPVEPEEEEILDDEESEEDEILEEVDDEELEGIDEWDFEAEEEEEPEEKPADKLKALDLGDIISKENAGILIATPFRFASEWTGFEGWLLTDAEQKRLAPMFRAILIKYLPDVIAEYFPEIIFAVVVIEIVGTKAKSYREWQSERVQTQRAQRLAEETANTRTEEEPEQGNSEKSEKPKKLGKDDTSPSWLESGQAIG